MQTTPLHTPAAARQIALLADRALDPPDDDEDQRTALMLGEIAVDVVWTVDYLGEPEVLGVEIGGLFADAWCFAETTLRGWRSAIALERDKQRADYIETGDE